MQWLKKNWMLVTIIVLAIIVLLYWYNSRMTDASKKIFLTRKQREKSEEKAEQQNLENLKYALAKCEKDYANVKIAPGVAHPCANLRKQVEDMQKAA